MLLKSPSILKSRLIRDLLSCLSLLLALVPVASFADENLDVEDVQFEQMAFAKDWNLSEEIDPILNVPVCRAWTSVVRNPGFSAELSISFPSIAKGYNRHPLITFSLPPMPDKAPLAYLRLDSEQTHPFILIKGFSDQLGRDVYWLPPLDYPKVIGLIREATTLQVIAVYSGTKMPLKISLTGSASTLKSAAACTGGKELYPDEFAKAINVKTPFGGRLPSDVTAISLQAVVQEAYAAYFEGRVASTSLSALQKTMKPLVEKETKLNASLVSAQEKLDRIQAELAEKKKEQTALESRRVALESELAFLTKDKPLAEADLQKKKAVYEPVLAKVDPQIRLTEEAEVKVLALKKEIDDTNLRIVDSQKVIEGLRAEQKTIESNIPALKRAINERETELMEAERRLSDFSVFREKQRILDENFNYRFLKNRLRDLEREVRFAEGDVYRSRREVDDARRNLNRCQSTRLPDGSEPNCGYEWSRLRSAEMDYDRAVRRMDQLQNEMRRVEWQIRNTEISAEQEAYRRRSALEADRNEAQKAYSDAKKRVERREARLKEINQTQIPYHESQIGKARLSLPGLSADLKIAETDLNSKRSSLAALRKKLDFDRIESEYLKAEGRLAKINVRLVEVPKEQKLLRSALDKLSPEISNLEKQESDRILVRNQLSAELQAVQKELAASRAEETRLQGMIEKSKAFIVDRRALYQAMYNKLTAGA